KICELLYDEDPLIILGIADEGRQRGQNYVKMSVNKKGFQRPLKIKGSNVWIETCRSAIDIRRYIVTLLERYGISTDAVKVFFRKDFSPLHEAPDEEQDS
ncbi:MAG: hypothetical protein K5656_08870, partial [Lachnospiraceae bacterium]|nr:hypothetical protein [Lachnospiraceae bacterium]